jgi:Arc/MetJ family transcription regulator
MIECMTRTNVVIDDELVARVKERYGLRTTREAIDFALRAVAGTTDKMAMLDMEGTGWDGDLAEMRRSRVGVGFMAESSPPMHGEPASSRPARKNANRRKGSRPRRTGNS